MWNDCWDDELSSEFSDLLESSFPDMMTTDLIELQHFGSYPHASQHWQTFVEDPNCLPSNQPLPNGVMHDHDIIDNNSIQNVDDDVVMAIQPGPSIPRNNYIANTYVAPNQLYNITALSPNWAFSGDQIKVYIKGKFLISPEEVQKYKWDCVFGSLKVPAKVLNIPDIIEGVLECQTPSHGNGMVQLFVTCSNGLKCEVGPFEFRRTQVMDVGNDAGISETRHFIIRLHKLLYLEPNTSQIVVNSCSAETLMSCAEVKKLLEDDSEWENPEDFIEVLDRSPHNVKDQYIQYLLQKQLGEWLFQKIQGGSGAEKVDREGQGVFHLVAALGYDRAIKLILAAGVITIDFQDVNQWTALDWASHMGRNDTVKLLKSHGATPGHMREPIHDNSSVVNPDINQKLLMPKYKRPPYSDILKILCNPQQHAIERNPPIHPPSGSFFLFDRKSQPHFRNDGYKWSKENRREIKGNGLYCLSAREEEDPHFRRCVYNQTGGQSDMVLVHYWEDKAPRSSSTQRPNWTGDHNSDDNPDLGRESDDNAPDRRPAVNQTSESNGVNQMHQPIAGGLQNCSLNGPDRLLLQDTLWDVTFTECSSVSSCDGNLHEEDNDNYSSSKQLVPDGLMHDGFEMIDSPDCCTSNRLEDVTEKTMQPCLDAHKGTVGSADGDEYDILA